jgi:DNA-binding beta-propeller fold protein YncE
MRQRVKHTAPVLLAAFLMLTAGVALGEEGVSASYLYNLSNFSGTFPVSWADISVDESHNEVYVLPGRGIKIFNDRGMEVYSFNESGEIGAVRDLAVDDEGNIIAISGYNEKMEIVRCNYRGERISTMELKNLPPAFSGFSPGKVFFRKGSFYFVGSGKVVVTDREGVFKDGYDLEEYIEVDEKHSEDTAIVGFSIDQEGNILFTLPVMAKAYVVTPDKKVRSFGRRGSRAGTFGVPAGIASDASGKFILVADTLRCVVMIFNQNFEFQTEFGFRGLGPGNLVGPMQIAVDSKNKLYVTQLRNRGVSVYQIAPGS